VCSLRTPLLSSATVSAITSEAKKMATQSDAELGIGTALMIAQKCSANGIRVSDKHMPRHLLIISLCHGATACVIASSPVAASRCPAAKHCTTAMRTELMSREIARQRRLGSSPRTEAALSSTIWSQCCAGGRSLDILENLEPLRANGGSHDPCKRMCSRWGSSTPGPWPSTCSYPDRSASRPTAVH
jgi:hypothetical protein